jgi:hypothetical protein
MNHAELTTLLHERIASLDVNAAKHDVQPFIRHPDTLAIWSQAYFMALTDKVICQAI